MRAEQRSRPETRLPLSLLSRGLLWLLLEAEDRRTVLGDLWELYEHRCIRDGERAARAWLRRQMASFPLRLMADRLWRMSLQPGRPREAETQAGRSEEPMQNLFRDLRHSLRSLTRTPGLTATILLTVGLGIGATTVISGVIHAVLLQPLPYTDSTELVRIYTDSPPHRWNFSVADYLALKEQQTSFSLVAAYQNQVMTFNRGEVAERVDGKLVTWSYFPLLGLTPLQGRLFVESDDVPGAEPTVVVSHSFWSRFLGGDPASVGQTIRLDGTSYTLIGVLPPTAGPLEQSKDFYAPARWAPPERKGPFFIKALGRLKPGIDRAAATAELQAIDRRLFPVWKASYQDEKATWGIVDLKEYLVGDLGSTLVIVLGAVGFLLLITCANAANLLLARAAQRSREMAVRSALGASRGRLLQHLLSESLLLALGAAAVGAAITSAGLGALHTVADYLPRAREIGWDGSVVWLLVGITGGSLLIFGLIPSLQGARGSIEAALRSGSRGATDSVGSRRLQRALVVLQFAVATPLLIGAGLLIGSLARLQRVDVGFDTHNLLTAGVVLPSATYSDEGRVRAFWTGALSRIQALPGVRGAALMDSRPPNETSNINNFDLADKPTLPGESQPAVPWVSVSPDAFDVLGLRLLSGRKLNETDRDDAPPVVVVDRAWAKRFFPGEDAVGRRFHDGGCTDCPWTTVVGVVEDVRFSGLDQPLEGTVYSPLSQSLGWITRMNGTVYFAVRASGDPLSLVPSIRQAVHELDPGLAVTAVATADELVAGALDTPRTLTLLVASFAAVALMLSLVGVYGVMSYFVQRHTKDIGIRLALGGQPAQVLGLVVKQGMRLVSLGLILGVAAALVLTRLMASLLFEVGATDPSTFLGVSAGLLGTSLIACFVPARRASGVDPARILREE
jgi:putative ABC transport system permease protein